MDVQYLAACPGRQSCRCLESGSLHPPPAALRRFPSQQVMGFKMRLRAAPVAPLGRVFIPCSHQSAGVDVQYLAAQELRQTVVLAAGDEHLAAGDAV